jgi:hypothetical protein
MEWVSGGEATGVESAVYVSRISGEVLWVGEGIDEEPPDDLEDASLYVRVPTKRDLELGRPLALSFVSDQFPESYDTVRGYFAKRGAYSRFKDLLDRTGHLDAWYLFERAATETRLREWCEENALEPVFTKNDG